MPTKTSRIPRNLNFRGETAFWGGIFCLEYPSKRSEKVNCHFVNYRFSFRKLQIFISFRSISFRFAPFRFANYSKPSPCCHPSRRNWFNYHIWFPRLDRKPTSFLVQFALICTFFLFFKNLSNIQYTQYIMYCTSSEIYYHCLKKHGEVKAIGFRTLS